LTDADINIKHPKLSKTVARVKKFLYREETLLSREKKPFVLAESAVTKIALPRRPIKKR
jgi:hypothetical protein